MASLDDRPVPIRALVVDDESLARSNVKVLLRVIRTSNPSPNAVPAWKRLRRSEIEA
jgi:hypothetical protein